MPVDLFLDPAARRFVEALSEAERLEVQAAIDHLMSDPEPEGTSKIRLPLPYRFGAIGYTVGRFFFTYEFRESGNGTCSLNLPHESRLLRLIPLAAATLGRIASPAL